MKVHMKIISNLFITIGMSLLITNICIAQDSNFALHKQKGIEVTGEFSPSGTPENKPERIDAGNSCIVDLIQSYSLSGTISGKVDFNYRILVKGPCGSPAGTFDEEWIAYGKFKGKINNKSAFGNMSYTAKVKSGGEINGIIVLGQGLEGELSVYGNFSDGKLSYKGVIK